MSQDALGAVSRVRLGASRAGFENLTVGVRVLDLPAAFGPFLYLESLPPSPSHTKMEVGPGRGRRLCAVYSGQKARLDKRWHVALHKSRPGPCERTATTRRKRFLTFATEAWRRDPYPMLSVNPLMSLSRTFSYSPVYTSFHRSVICLSFLPN